jgi:hypothetical protein
MERESQTSETVLMVRPAAFAFHAEAAQSNAFARPGVADAAQAALVEFDGVVERLVQAGVEVLVLDDHPQPAKPDAIFPNNWVSFHADGTMVHYPMATEARRLERTPEAVTKLLEKHGFEVRRVIDLSPQERDGHYLEGTGSLILDRPRRRAYASHSPRTDPQAIAEFDRQIGFSTFAFDARDRAGRPIYHTNVLMSLGMRFAILCAEAVVSEHRDALLDEIAGGGREIIEVDYEQLRRFSCNALELRSASGDPVIALSSAARESFTPEQLGKLQSYGTLVEASIPTIEAVGGGSLRCMIADVHLPRSAA